MSDSNYRSDLSDDAIFRRMKELEGKNPESIYAIGQNEAVGGLITNVDILAGIGAEEEKKQKQAQEQNLNLAASQQQMDYQAAKINNRISSGSFLKGGNWDEDLKLLRGYAANFFEKYDRDPSSITREEYFTLDRGGMRLVHECEHDPQKLKEVMENPIDRAIHTRAIFLRQRLISEGKLDPNLSHEEQLKKIEELIRKDPDAMEEISKGATCDLKDAQKCCHSDAEEKRFAMGIAKLDETIHKNHSSELQDIKNLPENERDAARKALQLKVAGTMGEEGKFIADRIEKFSSSEESMRKANALYDRISKYFDAKDVATELTNQDRKDILDQFNANGELNQATFDKAAKVILPDLKQQYPNLTEAELKAKYASDPEFRKEISKILERGVREFDHQHQGIPIEGISSPESNKPKFTFTDSFSKFFDSPPPSPVISTAVSAVSPLAGGMITAGSALLEKAKESPEIKAALANLTPDALKQVETIKEKCGCSHDKPTEKASTRPTEQQKPTEQSQPIAPTAPTEAQSPITLAQNAPITPNTGRG